MMYNPICGKRLFYNKTIDNPRGAQMKTLNEVVVEKLLKYMDDKNLTQYKLAALSDVPFPTIKSIMQRRTKGIELKTIILLSKGLGITPSEFINSEDFLAENLNLE